MSETPTYRYGMDVGGTVTWTSCSTPRLTRPIGDDWQFVGESDDGKRWYWQRVPRGHFESTGYAAEIRLSPRATDSREDGNG